MTASVIASLFLFVILACPVLAGCARVCGRMVRDSFPARLPEWARPWALIGTAVFGAWIVQSGSKLPLVKISGPPRSGGYPQSGTPSQSGTPPQSGAPAGASMPQQWDGESLRSGLVYGGIFTNGNFSLEAPDSAVTHEKWRLRGAARDGFRLDMPFGVEFGTNRYEKVFVSSSGTLSFNRPKTAPEGAPVPDGSGADFLAILQTPLGIVPEANRHRIAGAAESVFRHGVSARGSLLLTWQNALLHREPDAPVSFQAEITASGDVVFRYDFSALTNVSSRLADFRAGAQADFAGTDITDDVLSAARSAQRFAAKWYNLRTLGAAQEDDDGDGLSNRDEIVTHRTDPRNPDSDGDGLWDGEEAGAGLDPNSTDSLGDGTLDFWRVYDSSILTNAPWAESGDVLFTIRSQLENAAPDAYAVLRIGDGFMPVLPGAATARFAQGLNTGTGVSLIPGPEMTGEEFPVLSVTEVMYNTDIPAIFYVDDPGGIFDTSALDDGSAPMFRTQSAQGAGRASGSFSYNFGGTIGNITYTLSPDPLCLHTGNNRLDAGIDQGRSPNLIMGFLYNGQFFERRRFREEDGLTVTTWINGVPCAEISVTPALRVKNGSGNVKTYTDTETTIPVHLCGGSRPSGSADYADPPLLPGNPAAGRGHRQLIIGGDVDVIRLDTSLESWWHTHCSVCGCRYQTPHSGNCVHAVSAAGSSNVRYSTIPSSVGVTVHIIHVTGVSPGTEYAGDWMTYAVGDCSGTGEAFSHGRYTVLGLENHLAADGAHKPGGTHILAGVTNALTFRTDVKLPDGTLGVSLSGDAELIVRNRRTGLDEVLLGPGNGSTNFNITAWRGTYADGESLTVDARLVGRSESAAVLTQSFSGSGNGVSVSHSRSQSFTIHELVIEPVSAEVEDNGHVVNPAGFTQGDEAKFKIELTPGRGIDAGDIVWSASNGSVSYAGGSTGTEVRVRGDSPGETELRISIEKLRIDKLPVFTTEVYAQEPVNVTAWVVLDDQGDGMVTMEEITANINEANKILWQRGIKLIPPSTVNTTNRTDWLTHYNALDNTNGLDGLLHCSRNTGGIELYFVEALYADALGNNRLGGLCSSYGIALVKRAGADVLAHEVIHLYGLRDIYLDGGGLTVSGLAGKDTMSAKDWGAGFYPKTLTQADLIKRLLMKGTESIGGGGYVLPSGNVRGVMYRTQTGGSVTWSLEPVNVGLGGCGNITLKNY